MARKLHFHALIGVLVYLRLSIEDMKLRILTILSIIISLVNLFGESISDSAKSFAHFYSMQMYGAEGIRSNVHGMMVELLLLDSLCDWELGKLWKINSGGGGV